MKIPQIEALAKFASAVEAACVENGVTLANRMEVWVTDGQGGCDLATMESVAAAEGWHLNVWHES